MVKAKIASASQTPHKGGRFKVRKRRSQRTKRDLRARMSLNFLARKTTAQFCFKDGRGQHINPKERVRISLHLESRAGNFVTVLLRFLLLAGKIVHTPRLLAIPRSEIMAQIYPIPCDVKSTGFATVWPYISSQPCITSLIKHKSSPKTIS